MEINEIKTFEMDINEMKKYEIEANILSRLNYDIKTGTGIIIYEDKGKICKREALKQEILQYLIAKYKYDYSENERITKAFERMSFENKELKSINEELQSDNEELTSELESLKDENRNIVLDIISRLSSKK